MPIALCLDREGDSASKPLQSIDIRYIISMSHLVIHLAPRAQTSIHCRSKVKCNFKIHLFKFLLFIFSYTERACEICENLHHAKISNYMILCLCGQLLTIYDDEKLLSVPEMFWSQQNDDFKMVSYMVYMY